MPRAFAFQPFATVLLAIGLAVFAPSLAHAVDNDFDGYDSSIDCDDNNAAINPGAAEIPGDNVDQNCDAQELCYADADNDGYRTNSTVVSSDIDCFDAGEATASDPSGDCNDGNSAINPGAIEIAGDNVDQDCNGQEVCYADADNDGYRTNGTVVSSDVDCLDVNEAQASDPSGDCNDGNSAINPGAAELPGDNIDQNCDGQEVCFVDADNDNYRTSSTLGSSDVDCNDPGEASASDPAGDCDDGNPAINPGASEICIDDADNDCDGNIDCADSECSPCSTIPTTTSTTTSTTLAYGGLDHFKCYKVKDLKNPKFSREEGVTLDDQFENDVVDVLKPSKLCMPADKNGSGINDPVTHLCCYKIRGAKLDPKVKAQIADQFGTVDLEASSVKELCQPCTKTLLP